MHFLPERLRDGYGLQPAVERLHADGARVIVSVDCGIRSGDAADRARELGIDLIITDHHEPDAELPPALAVINPKRPDCRYPDKHLAGVGVALKVVQALCVTSGREKWLPAFVKIAAIGTIADVVPLVGENRVIAKLGLERLSQGQHTVGLRALLEGSGLLGKALDSFHVGFVLAPRINAAGRMSTPDIAARLLLASDEAHGRRGARLAEQLNDENTEAPGGGGDDRRRGPQAGREGSRHRRAQRAGGGRRGLAPRRHRHRRLEAGRPLPQAGDRAVLRRRRGPRLVPQHLRLRHASRARELRRPARALWRPPPGRRPVARARPCRRVPARVNAWADARLEPDDLVPRLRVDASCRCRIASDVVAGIESMAPFGLGNPRPVFSARDVEVVSGPHVLKERHLACTSSRPAGCSGRWPGAAPSGRRSSPNTAGGGPGLLDRPQHVARRNHCRIERCGRAGRHLERAAAGCCRRVRHRDARPGPSPGSERSRSDLTLPRRL